MTVVETKKVFFVIGEESGDQLGANLLDGLNKKTQQYGIEINPVGLAGDQMIERGVKSLFDISEISVMGISAVVARLPTIIRRILDTVAAIERENPDIIVLIDSPDFTHAVAKRVRKKWPHIPIIDYVCPSVWAWRQGRARKMSAYIDHVLALLSFEPKILKKLGGPDATYVGHRLIEEMGDFPQSVASQPGDPNAKPLLLVLPGSRRSELKALLKIFGNTVGLLHERGMEFDCVIPAVTHLADELEEKTRDWAVRPQIVIGVENKYEAFSKATAAMAASGTISLELALARVPMVLAYKLDAMVRPFGFLINTWSAALPNLIADYVVVPEEVNETASKERLVRQLERLMKDTPQRRAQLEGLDFVKQQMKVIQPPGEKAADVIFRYLVKDSQQS